MIQDLVIWGSGGHARELVQVVDAINSDRAAFNLVGFVDDDASRHGTLVTDSLEVLGGSEWLRARPRPVYLALGVGVSAARWRVARRAGGLTAGFPILIHPGAVIGPRLRAAAGVIVGAGAIITTDVQIGEHSHVNVAASVSHDCQLGSFVTLAPGVRLTGAVCVRTGADVGAGAVIIPTRTVGEWSVVGAGAVVVRDVPPNVTAVGVPARIISSRTAGWHC